ncbi:hypothetical protein IW140_003604 [Coemansia sp. RSA 1813]|nr:hypothetical protein EV178_003557 [Coemansia sp. RSA 1646]KAJ1772858.1 hypothetical protein LPJ74_001197 [Coemansia sp. RSA 1843]KAJ2088878.1 hypothetical protein IW138_003839 [Coemansia sp. RSA 986]KAJ2213971.1 hypothetical protein EV179_003441 [Coemansia sp. RSA 487]KAJ2568721.1 hypothetical protein IW140_003604 [Coemansia sp. RSA 1813]
MATTASTIPAQIAKTDERLQLIQLKEQLAEALGDDGPSYWTALRDFVQGKLNRQEFDFYAYMYLSGEKASLHNQFILATIHNAQSGQAPPDGEQNKGFEGGKKRKHDENQGPSGSEDMQKSKRSIKALLEDPRWRYVKELVKSLNKNERRAIKTLLKKPDITPEAAQEAIRMMKPVVLPMPASQLPQTYAMDIAKGITAPLVFDTKATPDIESLGYRMVAIALEQGLSGGITRDAGELLLYALDCHLKNVVSNMIYKARSNRALGIPVSNIHAPAADEDTVVSGIPTAGLPRRPTTGGLRLRDRLYYSKSTLHLSDLVFSLEISPNTTVEMPLCLERCSNMLASQVQADANAEDGDDSQNEMFGGSAHGRVGMLEIDSASPESTVHPSAVQHGSKANNDGKDLAPEYSGDGVEDDEHKQRRKVRRLRARYERWFGPYVNVQYGNGTQGD